MEISPQSFFEFVLFGFLFLCKYCPDELAPEYLLLVLNVAGGAVLAGDRRVEQALKVLRRGER